jgi:hypothetical protein
MEHVEGETIAEKLKAGGFEINETLRLDCSRRRPLLRTPMASSTVTSNPPI